MRWEPEAGEKTLRPLSQASWSQTKESRSQNPSMATGRSGLGGRCWWGFLFCQLFGMQPCMVLLFLSCEKEVLTPLFRDAIRILKEFLFIVWVRVCVHVCKSTYMCMWRPEVVSFQSVSGDLGFKTGTPHWTWNLGIQLDWLTSEPQKSSCLCPLHSEIVGLGHRSKIFTWVLGICLHGRLSHLPLPEERT